MRSRASASRAGEQFDGHSGAEGYVEANPVKRTNNGRPATHGDGRRTAAAIYGTIVTAAVIAAGGNQLRTAALAVTVVVTLAVYWLAELYAELIGQHTHAGKLPNRAQIRLSMASTLPMITASFLPVISLVTARLLGARSSVAAWIALIVTVILLVIHGLMAGRAAGLSGLPLAAITSIAGLLGVAMVVLKTLLQSHHG